jgi:PAS domain S-box-containing protein
MSKTFARNPTAFASDRLRLKVFLSLGSIALAFFVFCAAGLWYRYNEAVGTGQRRAENLTLILSEHFRRSVDATDATLAQLALHAERIGGARAAGAWTPVLAAALAGLPGVGSLTVIDENGTITASTINEIVGQSRTGFFLFKRLASEAIPGMIADPPFPATRDGRMLIPLGRRLQSSGGFAGIVVATLEPARLREFYRSVDVGPGGAIWVLHPAGLVLFREPSDANPIGQTAGDNPLLRAQRDRPQEGFFRAPLLPGDTPYFNAYRTLADPSVIVAVSLASRDVLATWRSEAAILGFVIGGMSIALLIAGFLIVREIGARALADRQTRRTADILDKTIASMADAVLVADASGRVVIANPAAGRMFSRRINSTALDPDQDKKPAAETSAMERVVAGEDLDNFEFVLPRDGQGKELNVVASGRPIRDVNGTLAGGVVVYRDVTQAQETERQLRQAQKMEAIGQLTGGVAHDFNNILTVILGTIGILEEEVAARPNLMAIAHMIDEAAERGAGLTRQLLAFARKQPLQPIATDINGLVDGAGKLLRPTLGEQVRIETVLEPDAWPALIDPSQLTNALINLAINACDSMPGAGKLTIETANVVLDEIYASQNGDVRPGPYVMIAVTDKGSGIPSEILDRVFEPFFTTKEVGKGTGLGLSMVYGFVKQSNGHIKIYSELGQGTSVKLYLPRAGEVAVPVSPPAPTAVGGSEAILVVEDDPLVRGYVTAQLNSLGYTTRSVAEAAEALALIDAGVMFDLLLTDVILTGGMNGRVLADEIVRRRPAMKVLFTSGYTENSIVHHGRLDPGVLLLAKPYRKIELARMVRVALQ